MGKIFELMGGRASLAGFIAKQARVSFSQLRNLWLGRAPIFHMTRHPEKLIQEGFRRTGYAIRNNKDVAFTHNPVFPEGRRRSWLQHLAADPGIDSTIYVSLGKPLLEYGNVGITGQPRPGLMEGYSLKDMLRRNVPEIFGNSTEPFRTISPRLRASINPRTAQGDTRIYRQIWPVPIDDNWTLSTLPQLHGRLIYDPRRVSREMALQLKRKNAIPINSRFWRLLKRYLKDLPDSELQFMSPWTGFK